LKRTEARSAWVSCRRGALIGAALAACSCDTSGGARCVKEPIQIPVVFYGGVSGRGELAIEPQGEANVAVKLSMVRPRPNADRGTASGDSKPEPSLSLEGPGTCRRGVLQARFGGGTDVSGTRVLGAVVEGLYQPQLLAGRVSAAWWADIAEKDTGVRRRVSGYVQEEPPPSTAER
jgi:hypothetical protein